jgi:hypothetical protein
MNDERGELMKGDEEIAKYRMKLKFIEASLSSSQLML